VSARPASFVGVVREAFRRAVGWALAHRWKALAAIVAVGVACWGLAAVGAATMWFVAIAVLAVMVVAALPDAWKAKVLEAVGGILAAIAGLVGINVLVFDPFVSWVGGADADSKGWIVAGLVAAVFAFGAMAFWYVRFRGHWGIPASLVFGVATALALVLGAPFVVAKLDEHDDPPAERVTVPAASELDVSIVADRPQPSSALPAFDSEAPPPKLVVRYSVGFRRGRGVSWTLLDSSDPAEALRALQTGGDDLGREPEPRAGADHVLLLLVDGTPPVFERPDDLQEVEARRGEVSRWRRVARAAGGPGAPAFALLQTTDPARRRDWTDPDDPVRPVAIQQELASPTVTDAALQLALGASSREDFELALRYQPVLLFDSKEPVPRPLSIDALFDEGLVSQCDDGGTDTSCEPVASPRGLENGGKRLELESPSSKQLKSRAQADRDAVRAGGPAALVMGQPLSAIYVHPTTREVNGRRRLYLDYWWYLPDNPARSLWGSSCGAGLVIPGVTCFDHQSDWEGVTVVVDKTERRGKVRPKPLAVHYAQHASVVRYTWDELRRHWDGDTGLPERLEGVPGIEERPLVFVASGTHASYATRCPGIRQTCRQLAHDIEEKRHNGKLGWGGNYTTLCGEGSGCLQLLPTRSGGARPALWNAFEGPWGARRCVLGAYCNSADPPHGPARQGRYARPAFSDGEGSFENRDKPFKLRPYVDE
jgi:hypothetical protein